MMTRLQLVWQQKTVTVPSVRPDSTKTSSTMGVNSAVDLPGAVTTISFVKTDMLEHES